MRALLLSAAAATLCTSTAVQALTVYGEDFRGQNTWGVLNDGVLNTGNGETWIVSSTPDGTGSDFSGFDDNDYFRVRQGEMTARDVDQVVYWISPIVSISGYENLNLSGTFNQSGNIEGEGAGANADFINVEYSLDGGLTFTFLSNINGFGSVTASLTGNTGPGGADWGSTILSEGLANGTAFQLRIAMQNSANTERLSFDDILLTGDAITGVPLPASGLLLAGALGLFLRRRRRV